MIRELTPELAKIAKEELNENPKTIATDLQHLKEWISKQPHLKARTDDQWLIALLRGCKYSLEKVKKKLDMYYTLRTTAPELTLRIKPNDPKFIQFFKLGTCLVLPKSKELLPRVLLIRAGYYSPATHNISDVMCMLYYLVQHGNVVCSLGYKPQVIKLFFKRKILLLEDDVASILGIKIMVDYEGVTMNHFTQAPPILKKMVAVSQDSMPLRLKGSHHINLSNGIEKIFTLISVFLTEKAKNRIKIYKNSDELFEHMPKEIIPKEYGGGGPTIADITEYWVSKFNKYKSWMDHEVELGTDESKRVGAPVSEDLMAEGSFRKLDID